MFWSHPSPAGSPVRYLALLGLALLLSGCGFFGGSPPATPTTPASDARTLTISEPQANASVSSPISVSGSTSALPAAASLNYRLFDGATNLLAQGTLPVEPGPNSSGIFSATISYRLEQAGPGALELIELSPTDGSVLAFSRVQVSLSAATGELPTDMTVTPEITLTPEVTPTLAPPPPTEAPSPTAAPQQQILFDGPPPGTSVGSPVVIAGRTALLPLAGTLNFQVSDAGGAILGAGTFPVLASANGSGSFNPSLSFNLPPNGSQINLDVFEPGPAGSPPLASARLPLLVEPPQAITVESPPPGTMVGSPVVLTGRTTRFPFQGTLGYRVLEAGGRNLGIGVFPVNGVPGGPSSFSASVPFGLPAAGGRIVVEIFDQNAVNGQIVAGTRLELNVAPQPQAIIIESPSANQQVGSPMTISGRTVRMPGASQLNYRVRDAVGNQIGAGQFGVGGTQEGGARFSAQVFFNPPPAGGLIALELLDINPANGQVNASTTLNLSVAGPPPTATPVPPPTPTPGRQAITIESPSSGTVVGSPVVITGRAVLYPQFRELYYVIRTLTRETLGQGSFPIAGQPGQFNVPFSASLSFAEPPQGGAIVVEIYDRDGVGQVTASSLVQLQVNPRAVATAIPPLEVIQKITIIAPEAGALIGSPATIDGMTSLAPYSNTLTYRVTDERMIELGTGTLEVRESEGLGFAFSGPVVFTPPPAGGIIYLTLSDRNEETATITAEETITLQVAPQPQ